MKLMVLAEIAGYVEQIDEFAFDVIDEPRDGKDLVGGLWLHATQKENNWCQEWMSSDRMLWINRCTRRCRDRLDPHTVGLMHRNAVAGANSFAGV